MAASQVVLLDVLIESGSDIEKLLKSTLAFAEVKKNAAEATQAGMTTVFSDINNSPQIVAWANSTANGSAVEGSLESEARGSLASFAIGG